MKKQLRKTDQWLEIAILYNILSPEIAAKIKYYSDNAPDDIIREEYHQDLLSLLSKFYWDETEEGFDYWQNIEIQLMGNKKYNYLVALLQFFAESVITEDVKTLGMGMYPNATWTDVEPTEEQWYALALLATAKNRDFVDLIANLTPKNFGTLIMAAKDIVKLKEGGINDLV